MIRQRHVQPYRRMCQTHTPFHELVIAIHSPDNLASSHARTENVCNRYLRDLLHGQLEAERCWLTRILHRLFSLFLSNSLSPSGAFAIENLRTPSPAPPPNNPNERFQRRFRIGWKPHGCNLETFAILQTFVGPWK